MRARGTFSVVAFLGSFLAFFLELSVAKMLLPRFGGSAYVWTACVMTFQALLLAGYLWAHGALRRWGSRAYARIHLALLCVPLAFLPLRLPPSSPGAAPLADLAWTLLRAAGIPFLALSTTVIVIQSWLGAEDGYFLYAASNLGALAALFLYPLVLEPRLSLSAQGVLWLGLYAGYVVLHLPCLPAAGAAAPSEEPASAAPPAARRALWLLLSAAPSAAMLATANLLAFDFAALPLLWVLPLAIYLLTFVLNFARSPWYPRRLNSTLLPVLGLWTAACLAAAVWTVLRAPESTPVQTLRRLLDVGKFGYVSAALFVVGMICHKSLAESRPSSERGMTEFYAWVAAGGWAGSACVGVLIPWLGRSVGALSLDWLAAAALALAGLILRDRDAWAARASARPFAALGAGALAVGLAAAWVLAPRRGVVDAGRSFYGVYSVVDEGGVRRFYHGNTDHGAQSLDPARRRRPLSYYNENSPLREAYDALGARWRSIAVVGLGAGAIAAYGRAGQAMDFYELDPDVAAIAARDFTYLQDSAARVRVVVGDARLSLEKSDASYDLLILDAFNSGAIPVHLVTKEALQLYLRRVPERDGVILLHVSNRYLDLRPVLAAAARDLGLAAASKRLTQSGRFDDERVPSCWIALSRDPERAALLRARGWAFLAAPAPGTSAWTDQHASLLPALAF